MDSFGFYLLIALAACLPAAIVEQIRARRPRGAVWDRQLQESAGGLAAGVSPDCSALFSPCPQHKPAVVCLRSVPPSGLSRSLLLPRPGTCLHSGIVTQLLSGAGEHLSIVSSRQWWKKCTFWFTETASEGSCSIMLPVLGLISQLSNILHYENGYRAWPNTAAGWLCCCNS